jgi:DNA invertase Pin-like site-specific DNA recombinase
VPGAQELQVTEIAVTWERVSTDAQETVNQSAEIAAYVAAHGYQIARAFKVEGASAFHGKHQADLDAMLLAVRELNATVVVVWHSDRLERRGARELLNLLDLVKAAGAHVESVKEPELGAASMGGQIMTFLGGLMAHAESAHKSDRINAKLTRLRAEGSWSGGKAPYGYSVVTLADGRKTLVPDADAPTVVRIFELTAAGVSYGGVGRVLRADGVVTHDGKPTWQEAAIGRIVKNVAYRGLIQFNGVTYMKVEPIIPASLWLAANDSVKARNSSRGHERRNKGGRPPGTPLRPTCGRCGAPLYRYATRYRCAGFGPTGGTAQRVGCGNTIGFDALNEAVAAEFMNADDPEIVTTATGGTDWAEEIAAVMLALKDLDLDAPDYDEQHAALRAELKRLRALPASAPRAVSVKTGRTEGDVFRSLSEVERRAFVRQWKLTVWPAGSEDQAALVASLKGRRWSLARMA